MTIMTNNQTTITDNPEVSRNITRYQNLDDNEIMITESKLENILLKHSEILKVGSDWKTPLGLIVAIITVFLTAEFNKDFIGIEPAGWEAIFIISLFSSLIWVCSSLYLKFRNRDQSITKLISLIKNQREEIPEYLNDSFLKIINGTYGVEEGGVSIDITDKLNSMIRDDRLSTEVNNTLVKTDPAPGVVKQLNIRYEYKGREFSKTFKENDVLILPPQI